MFLQLVNAFFSTLGFALLMHVPKKELILCGLTGVLSWFVFLIVDNQSKSVAAATFAAALAITFVCRILARRRKMPITVFLISGIIPLVPGAYLYRTMFAAITNDISNATYYGIQTFTIAGVISVGVILVLSLPNLLFEVFDKR